MRNGYIFHVTILMLEVIIVTGKITLGPSETRLLFELEKEGKATFDLSDVMRITGFGRADAWQIVYRLSRKRRITRVERGKYVLVPGRAGIEGDWSESVFLIIPQVIDEYYVGFWTAMSHWGMTEQIPNAVFVATPKRKRHVKYGGQMLRFITISRRKFFGFTQERIDKEQFNISTREKTVADALVFPQYCGGLSEVAKAIWNSRNELDWKKVIECIEKMGVDVALRRLGHILRVLRTAPEVSRSLAKRRWYGFRFLDPTGPKKALTYSKVFGLIINVPDRKLTSW